MPIASINQDESDKLLRMESDLHKRVISREGDLRDLRAIRRSRRPEEPEPPGRQLHLP